MNIYRDSHMWCNILLCKSWEVENIDNNLPLCIYYKNFMSELGISINNTRIHYLSLGTLCFIFYSW